MDQLVPANNLPATQNLPLQIRRLAAQREIYSAAKTLQAVQTLLAAVAVLATLAAATWSQLQPVLTAYGLFAIVLDSYLARRIKNAKDQAAKIQELYDCDVEQLDWNDVRLGEKPEMEGVVEHAIRHLAAADAEKGLKNWYTVEVAELPIWLARLVCQRENIGWDNRLRRSYAALVTGVFGAGIAVLLAAAALAYHRFGSTVAVLFTFASLAFPAIKFGFKHVVEAHAAAQQLADLQASAARLWQAAVDGKITPEEAAHKARLFQDCLFDHRRASPLIYDWIYEKHRDPHQKSVSEVSKGLIEEARGKGRLPPAPTAPQLPPA
jgi:hypothetical protein